MKRKNMISARIFYKRSLSEQAQDASGPRGITYFSGPEVLKWEMISSQKQHLR